MRNRLAVLSVLLACGCGSAKEKPFLSPLKVEIGEASKTELTLLQPSNHSAFRPGELVTIEGSFTVAKGYRISFAPKVLVIRPSPDASVDQVRSKLKESAPGEAVPFEAEIRCPKAPGKYEFMAMTSVDQDGSSEQATAKSNRIEFEVTKP